MMYSAAEPTVTIPEIFLFGLGTSILRIYVDSSIIEPFFDPSSKPLCSRVMMISDLPSCSVTSSRTSIIKPVVIAQQFGKVIINSACC